MNIGPFLLPVKLIVFFVSVVIALGVGTRIGKTRVNADAQVFNATLFGLITGRLVFVLEYLPSFGGSFVKVVDFRDLGLDPVAGIAAGVIYVLVCLIRRKDIRRPLLFASLAGLTVWAGGSFAATQLQEAPALPNITLLNTEGIPQLVRALPGRPRVVNLWATWCGPCQDEMPMLANAQVRQSDVDFVFVNQAEAVGTIHTFMSKRGISIANSLLDPNLSVAKALHIQGYPTTLFYDVSGQLQDVHVGRLSSATLDAETEKLIGSEGGRTALQAADTRHASSLSVKGDHGHR